MLESHQGVDEADCAAGVSGQVGGGVDVKGEAQHRHGGDVRLLGHRVGDPGRAVGHLQRTRQQLKA